MTIKKKTLTISLPESELAELDRVRERQSVSRSEALRQAVRFYIGAMRNLPPPEDPSPDEVEALREAEEEVASGGGRLLRAVLNDLERNPERSG